MLRPSLLSSLHISATALLAALSLTGASLTAQTAHYAGNQTIVKSNVSAFSVAVDTSGNVYFAAPGVTQVMKATPSSPGSNTYTTATIASNAQSLFSPTALAVDKNGDVYVLNTNAYHSSSALVELKPGTHSYSINSLLSVPDGAGLAVDGARNLFVAEQANHRVVKEWLQSNGTYTQTTVGTGWFQPQSLAVDGSDTVFVGATDQPSVVQEVEDNCEGVQCEPLVGAGWKFPAGVAVDPSENVYVADSLVGGVYQVPWNSYSKFYENRIGVGYGLSTPAGVAVDANQNVYIADSGNSRVLKVNIGQVNFGSWTVGTSSPSHTMTFVFDTAGTIGNVVVQALFSSPATNPIGADFVNTGAGTCKANHTYSQGQTCTIVATCNPKNVATYLGEAGFDNAGGQLIAVATLTCTGLFNDATVFSKTGPSNLVCTTYDSCGDIVSYAPGTIAIYNQPVGIVSQGNSKPNGCSVGSAHPPAQTLCVDQGPLTPIKKDELTHSGETATGLVTVPVSVSEIAPTSIGISWKTAAPAQSGVIYQAGNKPIGLTPKETAPNTDHSFLLDRLEPDTLYQATVWSYTGDGKQFHTTLSFRTPAN
jgi:hypothetical protein